MVLSSSLNGVPFYLLIHMAPVEKPLVQEFTDVFVIVKYSVTQAKTYLGVMNMTLLPQSLGGWWFL
ncbi:MAG TPA: hypothetical protein VEF33_13540 [Syntrophales bacterium]|nr:hypothetical protein [Syntrophales bacterium]